MKIRAVMIFIIAQVVLAKQHASRRSMDMIAADRAVRCNGNIGANSLSNTLNTSRTKNNELGGHC